MPANWNRVLPLVSQSWFGISQLPSKCGVPQGVPRRQQTNTKYVMCPHLNYEQIHQWFKELSFSHKFNGIYTKWKIKVEVTRCSTFVFNDSCYGNQLTQHITVYGSVMICHFKMIVSLCSMINHTNMKTTSHPQQQAVNKKFKNVVAIDFSLRWPQMTYDLHHFLIGLLYSL